MNADQRAQIAKLVQTSRDAVVCSIDAQGFPNAKAMFRRENEGLRTFWFSTNVSAYRTAQWQREPKACVYFMDAQGFHGLMLTGTMQVCTDAESKARIWREGDEQYYAQGVTDPDYAVLRFAAERGNYYHGYERELFDIAAWEEHENG